MRIVGEGGTRPSAALGKSRDAACLGGVGDPAGDVPEEPPGEGDGNGNGDGDGDGNGDGDGDGD